MKRFLRVFIPIILSLAIILCLFWYLFIYDKEFTRDILLYGARRSEAEGNHQLASWFYDAAYHQASDNDAVAIELAQQHKSVGNYTQAEYTLSTAIADGGGVDLYIALCKTYVEQDKLLDAVTMLDNISNADIKAELEALRPQTPVTAMEPGFYNQYISVELQSEGGTLYATSDGQYPSTQNAPYTDPITLELGENTIYALSVADNGLVSRLSIFGYTIGGVIEKMEFVDPAIESAVRTILEVSDDKELYTNDLWSITSFTVPSEAESLEDLRRFAFLNELNIFSCAPDQLSSLSGLATLTKLSIKNTPVSTEELQVIGNLPMLQELVISDCGLSTIAGLENAKKLTLLDLSDNTVRNIDILGQMTELKDLYLQNNTLLDLSALSTCTSLSKLDISSNAITSLSPICILPNLRWLNAADNSISEITQLGKLTNLTHLSLAKNRLTDVSALASCTNLTELNVSDNRLTDISAVQGLLLLTQFDFSYNEVTELPTWPEGAALVHIDGSHNLLTSLAPLSHLEYLNSVFMDYNEEIESVDDLASCHVLIQVNIYGTKVTNVDALTDRSIIVNYNPTQE